MISLAITARRDAWVNDVVVPMGTVIATIQVDDKEYICSKNKDVRNLNAENTARFLGLAVQWLDWELVAIEAPAPKPVPSFIAKRKG